MSDKHDMIFKLYVLNNTAVCQTAIDKINQVLSEVVGDRYRIDVIDLEEYPEAAEQAQILAIPTLVKEQPMPSVRLVGDLSNTETLLNHLGN